MNRRQFLGRFFQAVISAHNSKSIYGIYHPWRQYEEIKANVTVYLQFRTGTDALGNITYSSIPYTGNEGPIMAIYDSNNAMVYCSAYYINNGAYLYNTIRANFTVKLPPGIYTIKCLSLGKGLYLGESGQSMSFTVPEVSRYIDPSTGGYNKYNNYGNISVPSVTVKYLFDYEGMTFEYEWKYTSVGRDLRDIPGVQKYTYTYPSYEDTVAIAAEYGMTREQWTFNKYLNNCRFYTTQSIPYDECLRLHDIYKDEHLVHAYVRKGTESVEYRGSVDITCAYTSPSYYGRRGVLAVAYEQAFEEQSLPFDPLVNMVPTESLYSDAVDTLWMYDTRDGDTRELLYYKYEDPRYSLNLRTYRPTIGGNMNGNSVIQDYDRNTQYRTSSSTRSYVKLNVYTKKSDDSSYDTSSKVTTYVDILRFNYTASSRVLKSSPTVYEGLSGVRPTTESVKDHVDYRINSVLNYTMPKAKSDYDKMIEDWDSYTQPQSTSSAIIIPIDLILGRRKGVLPYKFCCAKSGSKDTIVRPEYYSDGRLKNLYIIPDMEVALNNETEIVAEPLVKGNIDLTGYEYGYDKRTGWYNNLILRQEIIHLDISDVPDHPILAN